MGKKYLSCFFITIAFFFTTIATLQAQNLTLSYDKQAEAIPAFASFPASTNTYHPILLSANDTDISKEDEEMLDEFEDDETAVTVSDPLYYFNYAMYSFNDFMYFAILKPVTTGYEAITPTPVRKGVKNFFHNLLFPVRFVNNLLQGEIKDAAVEVEIFLVNSTVGCLGLVQVAQNGMDLQTNDEDLGQTLGKWSIGNGFYIVWPFLGPSTLRDTIGLVGDSFLDPVNYVEPWEWSVGLTVYDKVNTLSFHLGDYEKLKEASLDPYVAIRNAYIQNRQSKVDQ